MNCFCWFKTVPATLNLDVRRKRRSKLSLSIRRCGMTTTTTTTSLQLQLHSDQWSEVTVPTKTQITIKFNTSISTQQCSTDWEKWMIHLAWLSLSFTQFCSQPCYRRREQAGPLWDSSHSRNKMFRYRSNVAFGYTSRQKRSRDLEVCLRIWKLETQETLLIHLNVFCSLAKAKRC